MQANPALHSLSQWVLLHEVLHSCPPPQFWKDAAKEAKGKPRCIIIDDYSVGEGVSKEERKNIEMLVWTIASHLGWAILWHVEAAIVFSSGFLLSESAAYITGGTTHARGGLSTL